VDNVLTRLNGTADTKAVLIVGHYDGVASGPGAGDSKIAVAAMLEALRAVQTNEWLRNDVIFLFPDGEEYGLIGAQAFIDEHPWARDGA
jgi:Zn-dependent M28 family amino/carboxypeptidase